MKCSEVRTFLTQINDRQEAIAPVPPADLEDLSTNGYVLKISKEDYNAGAADVAVLAQAVTQLDAKKTEEEQAVLALQKDEQKEHSFVFHLEGKEEKEAVGQRVQSESDTVSREAAELNAMEAKVNELIQKKSMIDRMAPYGGDFLELTGLGTVILNDLNVRNYRVADEEFSDFTSEIKGVYAELRSIAGRASSYVAILQPMVPKIEENNANGTRVDQTSSVLWSTAIGLAKLQGDNNQIIQRFMQAFGLLGNLHSTIPNKLMAAEIMTALSGQDIQSLAQSLYTLDQQLRNRDVPQELSVGVAATIMAGRRFDGTYPLDRFFQFKQQTESYETAAILAVMNVPWNELTDKLLAFRHLFLSWGYIPSEDTEISSAFLAIGELAENEVEEKLKYIVEQLRNYLEYPLVAAAILASIPVFEAHEVLDLMEKAVTLLSAYASGLERSELVALAVRMIHGVRNELVKEIDPTAKVAATPVQFTYISHPGFFIWYFPVILAHSSYHATFSGMGGFHPAHSHGIGGFAG